MTMRWHEARFGGARTRPQQRRPLAFRFGRTLTTALILATILASSCGGTGKPGVLLGPVALSPEITIQFLSDAPVVQHGYLVGFRARTVGIADLAALEWSVNGGDIICADADKMWWWPPNVPDGEQYTITASYGDCSGTLTVTMKTELPPIWADDIEICLYVAEEVDWVQSGWRAELIARPFNWYGDVVEWTVSAGEIRHYEEPYRASGYFWYTPITYEDMEVLITFIWRGIPLAERRITVKGIEKAFHLDFDSDTVVVSPSWMGNDLYIGRLVGDMSTPDWLAVGGLLTVYAATLEKWEPNPLPAEVSLDFWDFWGSCDCSVVVHMTREEFETLLPATADLVVRRYATEQDRQAGIVMWEERLPINFVAYTDV